MMNEAEIRKAIVALHPDSELFEVRLIAGKWNASGYFTDAETLIQQLRKYEDKPNVNVYITLQVIEDGCYSRKQHNKLIEKPTETTSDNNIIGYRWLMIDLDPKRASGISSTDAELEAAKTKANEIYKFMRHAGWNKPLIAISGNGVHLLYRIELRAEKDRTKKIESALKALDMLFSDGQIEVDTTTFNPSRICKLYGTKACKGANTVERPHRMSYIHSMPDESKPNDITLLDKLASILPQEPEKPQRYNSYNPNGFQLEDWIVQHDIQVKERLQWGGGTKWVLKECPFNSEHKGKDAAIIQTADGKICFHCFHNSCADNHWKELRLKFEPDAYDQKAQYDDKPVVMPNYSNPNYTVEKSEEPEAVEIDGKPVFYTTEQIRLMETPPEEFIRTGITEIDNRLKGLRKGFVTVLSGLRAAGKSSVISQLTIEAAQQGYRTALFSGELTNKKAYDWLILQAAGKNHIHGTRYENFFCVDHETEPVVSKWLDEKVYIYNNEYGNEFKKVYALLNQCTVEHKVDLIIIDNLMALNINQLGNDKFDRQSLFVSWLENFAKKCNVHVLFVAHPRKNQGFLRLEDISGSNDIVNRVDNAMIIHRVGMDFKTKIGEFFNKKAPQRLLEADNVVEICKSRDTGVQDCFIPLYFEKESKRLKNQRAEYKHYGWEEQFAETDEEPPF